MEETRLALRSTFRPTKLFKIPFPTRASPYLLCAELRSYEKTYNWSL